MSNLEFANQKEKFYYQMFLIRNFEKRVLELFEKGKLSGTTHCYIGQEANAVAIINNLKNNDIVVSNHRCHGHYLTLTNDVIGLLAELMGKEDGVCGGRGGSQHLCKDNFFTNGVQGSMVPIAAGMAYAEKKKRTNAIVVLFIGDGTFGQGVVYETFNMISLWKLPILIVVENNRYAQTTPITSNFAGTFSGRTLAFDLSFGEIESNDVEELNSRFKSIINNVRNNCVPHVEVIHTYRLCPHSKSDDHRPKEEIKAWEAKDPLIEISKLISSGKKKEIEKYVFETLHNAETVASRKSYPKLK